MRNSRLSKILLDTETTILGIGNPLRGDDGFGSILAKRLKGKTKAEVLDVETSPENFLGKILENKPKMILILDCADFGAKPGQIKLFNYSEFRDLKFYSTHNISLNLFINFLLKEKIKNIMVLVVQPKEIKFKRGLSKEVSLALKNIEKELLNTFRWNK